MRSRLERLLAARLDGFGLSARELLSRDAPGGLAEPGLISANRHCRLLPCRDGWVALNLARPDDIDLVPALTGFAEAPWISVARYAAGVDALEFRDRAIMLQLPVAIPGEAMPLDLAPIESKVPRRVLDLSALWAGPLCAGLLGRMGAHVLRIDSIGRPDPTPQGSPRLDALINQGKQRLALDLRTGDGRKRLLDEVAQCDVLVTSARPAALARLGLEPDSLTHLTWVAITAHGFAGPGALRVGFGDDCAVAGGLIDGVPRFVGALSAERVPRFIGASLAERVPRFIGDALADPLTGLEAARAVLAGRSGLIDMAMARLAASYAAQLA